MIVPKIALAGIASTLSAATAVRKLSASIHEVDITNPDVSNEINRAWLCDEVPDLDKFVKKEKKIDLNRQYLCSDQDYEF